MSSLIKTSNISKSFFLRKNINILKRVNIEIKKGEMVSLIGPSGSGKSTFLHLLALLDKPSNGDIFFEGKNTSKMSNLEKDKIRGKKISIIYQQNNLLSDFTCLENVSIAMIATGKPKNYSESNAKNILKKVGLSNRLYHFPNDLSGGEQQRVAFARAIINNPLLILADEPTGSLDRENARELFKIFIKYKSNNQTIIYATHNRDLASKADYMLKINDGKIKRSNE